MTKPWQIRVDTGGTFTDTVAIAPDGRRLHVKVLSSSALRGRVRWIADRSIEFTAPWHLPVGFADGAEVRALGGDDGARVVASSPGRLTLDRGATAPVEAGRPFEIRFPLEAPVLAAHLVTATPPSRALPPLQIRLATTRGTNALLERRGARVAFFVTAGFGDLLRIGDQRRPDLFALAIDRPAPLPEAIVEVPERLDANGVVVRPLDLDTIAPEIERLRSAGFDTAAVALVHAYRNDEHERQVVSALVGAGFRHVSSSAALSASIGFLTRAETAVVDAYLAPVIEDYLARVEAAVGAGALHVMTSAGGLVRAAAYRPKDSLLSGPAGGVVGASAAGRACGVRRLIAFDMGGTSTDVSRYDGDFTYRFEPVVGGIRLASPALEIETVAAGGGSVCWSDAGQLKVGPHSAGAHPGPACYGAGGPLTLTDVNMLLGRLDAERFGIPIDLAAARRALDDLCRALATASSPSVDPDAVLHGALAIADERMAGAIRQISVRRGYDPRAHALVAFGGAGGQHACAVARLLGIDTVVLPPEAGLLSAAGLHAARVERFVERPVLEALDTLGDRLEGEIDAAVAAARAAVVEEGVPESEVVIRRRLVFLRLAGQEHALEVDWAPGPALLERFRSRYRTVNGYDAPERPVEAVSVRAVASSSGAADFDGENAKVLRSARPSTERRARLGSGWRDVPVYRTGSLSSGDGFSGPALVVDPHSALWLPAGWSAAVAESAAVVATCSGAEPSGEDK